MSAALIFAGLSDFFDAVGQFFGNLADIRWGALALGLLCFGTYLTIRSRAFYNVLRAAYPTEKIEFKRIWGAYIAAYGFNNVVPARGGDVIKLFLVKTSIPNSTYSAIAAAFFVEFGFDASMGLFILAFAFSQGVFPKPPDFSKLGAFDLSFFASHPRFLLFVLTALAIAGLVGFALLSTKVKAFWARVRQGLTIIFDRKRYFREVWLVQFGGWCFRFAAFWFLLDAFHIGGSVKNVLLVLGVNAVAAVRAVHPRRRGRPAGVPGQGLRRDGGGCDGGRVLGRPADRDRRVQPRGRLLRAGDGVQIPVFQGGHRGRA